MNLSSIGRGVIIGLLAAAPAAAQDSRAEILARAQAEKAASAPPYVPNRGEVLVKKVEQFLYGTPDGFYPYFASVESGGGLTGGAGFRRFYGDATWWDVKGLYSIKGYRMAEVSTTSAGLASGALSLTADLGFRDATQVGFYGVGADTAKDDRANYRYTQTWVGGEATYRPLAWASLGGRVAYEAFDLQQGHGRHPSIETAYSPLTAPGLGDDPGYVHATASAGIDTRPAPGYARRGSALLAAYHSYDDRRGRHGFDRVELDAVQHLPLLRETWVVSLHGNLTTTVDGDVPYFLMPSLGGGDSLRGYSSFRFRDRHSLLLQGELRWIPNRYGLDMALFCDAGTVAPERSGLGVREMKADVGIGVRLHSLVSTPLRIDVARGSEGVRVVFSGSAAF